MLGPADRARDGLAVGRDGERAGRGAPVHRHREPHGHRGDPRDSTRTGAVAGSARPPAPWQSGRRGRSDRAGGHPRRGRRSTDNRYATSGNSSRFGRNARPVTPSCVETMSTVPSVGGSRRTAPASEPASTGRANVTMNAVVTATRSPAGCVATAATVVASRVRKTERTGRASGWPDRASAPDWTVIVWNVPAAQWSRGATVRTVPLSSQASVTGVGGSTVMDAATEAGSIGALNRMVAGSVSARSVENAVVKAAWVSGQDGLWDGRGRGRRGTPRCCRCSRSRGPSPGRRRRRPEHGPSVAALRRCGPRGRRGRPAARRGPDAIDAPARWSWGTHRGRGSGRSGGGRPR